MIAASFPDWLQAAGGVSSAIAAVVLAFLAYKQMMATKDQAAAADRQVQQMRKDAEEERQHREREQAERERAREVEHAEREREQSERERALQGQLEALGGITLATRDASRAQLQPVVFAHARGGGGTDLDDAGQWFATFPYYLANEGTGLALNIEHGVEVGGVRFTFADRGRVRSLRPGESAPPRDEQTDQLRFRPYAVTVPEDALPADWRALDRSYWARFESVFDDVFETQNPLDPRQSASFMKLTELSPGDGGS